MSTSENSRDSEVAALVDFVELFLEDNRAGIQRSLQQYLERFPNHQDAIAREYLALRNGAKPESVAESTTISTGPFCDEGPLDELIGRLRARPFPAQRLVDKGEIARGGMGAILRVWDEDLRREIAMKVALGKTPRLVASFIDEAQITSRLDHPGIVPVHDIGIDASGSLYFSMRLVRGRELKEIIKLARANEGGWSLVRALDVILRVCEAMAYAHSKGVVHRDLKPSNIMVGEFGEVYVMDWGLARASGRKDRHDLRIRDEHSQARSSIVTLRREERENTPDSPLITMDGLVVGTPCYMSPEQARGNVDELGPRSDVYSVGAMLYELLTGQKPYITPSSHLSSHTVLAMVLQGPPAPVHELDKTIPAELEAICEKAMARTAEDRYADTRAMARDLRAYMEQRVVTAYETGALAEIKKWCLRNTLVAGTILVALLLFAAGFVVILSLKTRAERNEFVAQERADDVLSLAAIHDLKELVDESDKLWPAHPEMVPKYQSWLERARIQIDGQEAVPARGITRRLSLKDHEAKLAELRKRAKRRTDEQIEAARRESPGFAEYDRELGRLTWMKRMLGETPWPTESEVELLLAKESLPQDAEGLNARAWVFVTMDEGSIVYGNEIKGLILARRALTEGKGSVLVRRQDTLAWALFRSGRFGESVAELQRVLKIASAGESSGELAATLAQLQKYVERWTSEGGLARTRTEVAELEARVTSFRRTMDEPSAYAFDDSQDAWWHSQLATLVAELKDLSGADSERGRISMVEKRLEFALGIESRSLTDPSVASRWSEAVASIKSREQCPQYDGLVISPQIGLVPIGRDPQSGLWEFAHLQTGEVPVRDKEGELVLTEETSLVFVLIPGGTFLMGEQHTAPDEPHYIRIPSTFGTQRMSLDAFFFSKYEMTQGQWQRFEGRNPSKWNPMSFERAWTPGREPGSLLHPVESVSWIDCDRTLSRLGLSLPTEAQWEYAARAGTDGAWWTGNEESSCFGVVNLLEAASNDTRFGGMRDGYEKHAPVGTFPANRFGLHEVAGNVAEWCRDVRVSFSFPTSGGDGLRLAYNDSLRDRVTKGGSYPLEPFYARMASRVANLQENARSDLGVRPLRKIGK